MERQRRSGNELEHQSTTEEMIVAAMKASGRMAVCITMPVTAKHSVRAREHIGRRDQGALRS